VIVRKPWRSPTVVLTEARPLIDERRKWPEDIAAKLEAIQGAYEATSDAQKLCAECWPPACPRNPACIRRAG
jgi:hypothetical protein